MNNLKVIYKNIDELIPYINNPRKISDKAIDAIAGSIKEFGFKVPIVIDKENVIVNGHGRLLGSKKLGLEKVTCIIADDLTEQQIKAFRIADNKVSELAEWDNELLEIELGSVDDIFTGFSDKEIDKILTSPNEQYTTKVNIPHYEIKGEKPKVKELADHNKSDLLIQEIEQSNLSDEDKQFLKMASYRHIVFDYGKIAEFYAHASNELQELMERSALIIIDYDDAIKNGYVQLSESIKEMIAEENGEE